MAYQLQTLPQFTPPNPTEAFMKSYGAMQDSHTKKLEQQKLKKDLDNYDRELNAQLAQMLAATEASQASTAHSQQLTAGAEFQNLLAQQFGAREAEAAIGQMNSAARTSQLQAEVQKLLAQQEEFKLQNPELFFSGPAGEIAQRKFVQQKYGNESVPFTPYEVSEENASPDEMIFNEVFQDSPSAYKNMIARDIIPADPAQYDAWLEQQGMIEASMTPMQQVANTEFAKQEAKNRPAISEKLGNAMSTSNNILANLDKAQNAFNKLDDKEKGFVFGSAPELTGPANEVATSIATIVNNSLQSLRGMGQVSNLDLQWIIDQLPQRKMTDEGFAQTVKDLKKVQELIQKNVIFSNTAMNVKGLDSVQAQTMWNYHLYENPLTLGSPAEDADEESKIDEQLKSRGAQ